jgi:hypothetical protein
MTDYELKLVDSSRFLADLLVSEIENDRRKFESMLAVALLDKYPVSMRAARVLQLCAVKYPSLPEPFLNKMTSLLSGIKVDGVRRSMLKILISSPVLPDEEELGHLVDDCFDWMQDKRQPVAVRAYAIDLLVKIIEQYPDLRLELITSLLAIQGNETPGMKAKCKQVIQTFRKQGHL